ncbi:LacI family DNA-binding transcriptional regulator [Arcanobacterium hippocoleae]
MIHEDIMTGFEDGFGEEYFTIVAETRTQKRSVNEVADFLIPNVSGIVLVGPLASDSQLAQVYKRCPTVAIQRFAPGIPSVLSDTEAGIKDLINLFISKGHQTFTYVRGPEGSWMDGIRWRFLHNYCHEIGVKLYRTNTASPDPQGGFKAAKEWLTRPTSAVVTFNDMQSAGFIQALNRRGIRVPEAVSVAGFDNSLAAPLCNPPLTTLAGAYRHIGKEAARLLRTQIQKKQHVPAKVYVPMFLTVRGSVGTANPKIREIAEYAVANTNANMGSNPNVNTQKLSLVPKSDAGN